MSWYDQYDPNDPYSILDLGQQYNPYQGYPTKQVSDQVWDLISPTPDYLVAQQFGALTPWAKDFSTDAFFAADPLLRGPLAQALAHAKGDSIGAYNYLGSEEFGNSLDAQLDDDVFSQLAQRGNLDIIGAVGDDERKAAALDFYRQGLEDILAAGAPTTQRNAAQYDWVAERMGGRPYPGAGSEYPQFGGPGFGGGSGADAGSGSDPLAQLAGSPAYSGGSGAELNTPFGAGIQDVGAATGEDRLDFTDKGRYAVIGGRRYQLPDTMESPELAGGNSPAYQRALEDVLEKRRQRLHPKDGDNKKGRSGPGVSERLAGIDRALGFDRLRRAVRMPDNPFKLPWG